LFITDQNATNATGLKKGTNRLFRAGNKKGISKKLHVTDADSEQSTRRK